MKKFILCLFISVSLFGNAQTNPNKMIFIQPLGDVNPAIVNVVKSSVESFFGFSCILKPKVEFTTDILAGSKTRYEAGKILDKYHSNNYVFHILQSTTLPSHSNLQSETVVVFMYNLNLPSIQKKLLQYHIFQ